MANLAVWLFTIAAPLVRKVLLALGIGWITYAGLTQVAAQVQTAVLASWGQLGVVTLQIVSLAGFSESIGILLSAITARAALMAADRLGKVASS